MTHRLVTSFFDWNGLLEQQIAEEQSKFHLVMRRTEAPVCMGFYEYEILGTEDDIINYIRHYNLDDDDELELILPVDDDDVTEEPGPGYKYRDYPMQG